MAFKKRFSKVQKQEFAQKMQQIEIFCKEHDIQQSSSGDSYYFTVNGCNYRVSNHSVERSNDGAFDQLGEQVRDLYHPNGREKDVTYIHAGKTRIIEIYNNLAAGLKLDGRGNAKEV